MATYEYSAYSSWDTRSYSWGTGKTRCWIGAYREYPSDTKVRVYMHGCVQCDSTYNLSQYGVHVRVGHNGGNTTSAWGVSDHRGDAVFDGTNAWLPSGYCTSYDDFVRTSYDYTVTFYCDYWGETVNGYGGCSNTGKATVSVTIPALAQTSYTVSYNANGGTGAPSSQTKTSGTTLVLSNAIPVKAGHTFQGWGTYLTDATVDYAAGANYTANSSINLYAIWSPHTCTITYDANGGSGAPSSQSHTYGTVSKISNIKPIKDGYAFLGWSLKNYSTKATWIAGGRFSYKGFADGDTIVLYAVWKKIKRRWIKVSDGVSIESIRVNISSGKSLENVYFKVEDVYLTALDNTKFTDSSGNHIIVKDG